MRTKILSLDAVADNKVAMQKYFNPENTGGEYYKRMKRILKTAMELELTARQYECIEMYYIKKIKVKDIAKILKIKPTTVYKHIRLGVKSLKKCAAYL